MLTGTIAPAATDLLTRFEAIGDGIRDSMIPPMAAAIAIAQNLGTFMKLAAAQTGLAMVQLGNSVAFFFTDQLPAFFNWFLDNWGNLWRDALSITQTAVMNLADNIGTNMAEIWNYIASGGTSAMELAWKPLLDGFESTVSELPKIADRVPGQLEKGLGTMVSDLEGKLQADMAGTMDALQKTVEKKPITPKVKPPDTGGGETITPVETKAVGVAQQGTREALSAIFGSMRGEDYQKQLIELNKQQLEQQRRAAEATEALAAEEGVGIEP
jgi:hypothetical protein